MKNSGGSTVFQVQLEQRRNLGNLHRVWTLLDSAATVGTYTISVAPYCGNFSIVQD